MVAVYRIYSLDTDNQVTRAPHLAVCDNDDAALKEARQYLKGHPIEVWLDAKRVARLEPEK